MAFKRTSHSHSAEQHFNLKGCPCQTKHHKRHHRLHATFEMGTPTLKADPKLFKCPPDLSSDVLVVSPVPASASPRDFYLKNYHLVPPPLISISEFIPKPLAEHLMRNKKDSALGQKFVEGGKHADDITNMEGALHTFVTPAMTAVMVGDYLFRGGHGIVRFGSEDGKRKVRNVVMSASIQMDFEFKVVMFEVSKIRTEAVLGESLLENPQWEILGKNKKQDDELRNDYDDQLRSYMVYHLTKAHTLPARDEIDMEFCMSVKKSVEYLEEMTTKSGPDFLANIENTISTMFTDVGRNEILSLELLLNTALHQLRNELSALESMCPRGYVYTYDPPSIFAGKVGATLLNRLLILALKVISEKNNFTNMRIFGFNDYVDKEALTLVQTALANQSHVHVCSKSRLFQGKGGLYDLAKAGEKFEKTGGGAMLIVHNNSDGFGQNIESEGAGGSLDGAIGASSSAAGSLLRKRDDLVAHVF